MTLTIGDTLMVALVGIMIVFFGLVILIGIIKIMALLTQGRKKEPKKTEVVEQPVVPVPVESAETNNDELIAVISAAIAAAMGNEANFIVRRVRRVSNAPAWQKAGREEQVYSRF